jgi:hypothetical protein
LQVSSIQDEDHNPEFVTPAKARHPRESGGDGPPAG